MHNRLSLIQSCAPKMIGYFGKEYPWRQ